MAEDYNVITLEQFVNKYDSSSEKDIPELKKMFLSMDKKMKMYHDNNYVISSFRLQDILVYSIIDDNGEYQYDVEIFPKLCRRIFFIPLVLLLGFIIIALVI